MSSRTLRIGLFVVLLALAGLWLAWRSAYEATSDQGATAQLVEPSPALTPPFRFTDASAEAGLDFRQFGGERGNLIVEDMGSGVAIGDYDNDGDLDLYVVASNPLPAFFSRRGLAHNALYRNRGDGHFEEVARAAGVAFAGIGMGAVFVDLDGDGLRDLLLTNFGPDRLYQNQGGGHFRDISAEAGITHPGFSAGAAVGDVDGDGDLDLYIPQYLAFDLRRPPAAPRPEQESPSESAATTEILKREDQRYVTPPPYTLLPVNFPSRPNLLYRNDGGRFVDVSAGSGAADPMGRSLQSLLFDLSGDGHLDLLVANDVSMNRLFLGRGDGTFNDVSAQAGLLDPRGSMGLGLADFDGDGRLDLFASNYSTDTNALWLERRDPHELRYVAGERGAELADPSLGQVGWGLSSADFDLDGWPDLYIANGHIRNLKREPSRLGGQRDQVFRNRGDGRFEELTDSAGSGMAAITPSRGLASADLDGDGDEDLVVVDHSGRLRYLRNDQQTGHHWLKIRLRGPQKNRDGVGALVTVHAAGRSRVRAMIAGTSYLSDHGRELVFGLGSSQQVKRILVRWPDGKQTTHGVDAVDRLLTLRYGAQ